ncbi:hypothetical protein [Streptomyces sp. NPDC004976]
MSVSTEMIARLKYANGFRPAGMSCWMRWMPVESSLTRWEMPVSRLLSRTLVKLRKGLTAED